MTCICQICGSAYIPIGPYPPVCGDQCEHVWRRMHDSFGYERDARRPGDLALDLEFSGRLDSQ
jgi:hypothetical protein